MADSKHILQALRLLIATALLFVVGRFLGGSLFENNTSGWDGGAAYLQGDTIIVGSTFVNNDAVAPGMISMAITRIAPTASNELTTTTDNQHISP